MNINKGHAYQLIEMDGGIIITDRNRQMPHASAIPLVIADRRDLCEYLVRYLAAREAGLHPSDAHNAAIMDAAVGTPKV